MNFLKSIYIVFYISAALAISIMAVVKLLGDGNAIAWSGVLLSTAPFMMVLSWLMLAKPAARTSRNLPVITLLAVAGLVFSLWGWNQQQADFLSVKLAGAGLVGFLIYVFWYSAYNNRSSRIILGQLLPNFSLQATNGQIVTNKDFIGKASILMFYRGNWCPLCMAQIKEVARQYDQLREANVRVALISPQPHKNTMKLAEKFHVGFEFYIDEGNQAARTLGVSQSFGVPIGLQALGYDSETVLPTVVITDAKGNVIWLHETDNYRIRPEPETFLQILREHGIG